MKKEHIILFLALVLSFVLVNKIHWGYTGMAHVPVSISGVQDFKDFKYEYPIHADEWNHLARMVSIMDNGLSMTNPYSSEKIFHIDYDPGFHALFAGFFIITGLDPVSFYQYLAAIFFIINAIALFLLIRYLTKNFWISIFSILFLLRVPSNTNIMGHEYAIPLTFSLFLIYLFTLFFMRYFNTKDKKYLYYSIVIFILVPFFYPLAAVLLTSVALFLLFQNTKLFSLVKKYWIYIVVVLLLMFFKFNNLIVFNREWTSYQYNYSLLYYGIIATVFALIGGYRAILRKKLHVLVFWPLLFLVNLTCYWAFDVGFFVPYERSLFYYMVGLAPLSAIGLWYCFDYLKRYLPKKKSTMVGAGVLFFGLVFFVVFSNYSSSTNFHLAPLFLVEDQDYQALVYLKENLGEGNVILAHRFTSLAVYPVSKNYVVTLEPAHYGFGDYKIFDRFLAGDCKRKKEFFSAYDVDYVLSRKPIECDYLIQIYNNNSFIYCFGNESICSNTLQK